MEASIEHLTRGTLREVDILLIVTEPYFRALQTLGRTVPLARELGIPTMYVVANKVRLENDARAIEEYTARLDLDVLATIPYDEAVQEIDRNNIPLADYHAESAALTAILELVKRLDHHNSPSTAAAD